MEIRGRFGDDGYAPGAARSGGRLFGRDHELHAAFNLLEGAGPRGLILSGEPGIGKTAIWRELLEQARARGFEVLSAMPSSAEVQLTFAALADLVDGFGEDALERLPAPQRYPLEVALLRADGRVADARAIGVALLGLLRTRGAERPLLIGIDDLQWLDAPSARALGFALRRLGDDPVAVAATLRTGAQHRPALDLGAALGSDRLSRIELGPLTLAAIHELILARLRVELPRRTVVGLFEAAGGNPFVASELAQGLSGWVSGSSRGPRCPSRRASASSSQLESRGLPPRHVSCCSPRGRWAAPPSSCSHACVRTRRQRCGLRRRWG